jgi:molybdenum cofactor cytidylyltransferase
MTRAPVIAAVVLAAGRSTRAGNINKLTADIAGTPMVARVVDTVLASSAHPVIVVTGHEQDAVRSALSGRDVRFVFNPDYADGIATSIATGIRAVPPDCDGALICLGDMPALRTDDIDRLIKAFDSAQSPICVPFAGTRRGNPALFSRAYFAELASGRGDTGARTVIAAHKDVVRDVAIAGEGPLTDLDTAADIAAFSARPIP